MTELLQLKHLGKSYAHAAGSVPVLLDVEATVRAGERIAIVGPSGSGKSTLLSLLAGLDRPTTGSIAIAGRDLASMNERQLTEFRAQNVGIIFQQFHLMAHLTAAENVALPLRIGGLNGKALDAEQSNELAAKALADVGLGHRLTHLPRQLSGGECQRVAIARAMVRQPPLLLADEPSGNLDVRTGEQVMRLLFDLVKSRGATLVLVTHNEELATWCDRRLLLSNGRLNNA